MLLASRIDLLDIVHFRTANTLFLSILTVPGTDDLISKQYVDCTLYKWLRMIEMF